MLIGIYTRKEITERVHPLSLINSQALAVCKDLGLRMCRDNLPRDYGQLYTLQEVSDIVYTIISDSMYYGHRR